MGQDWADQAEAALSGIRFGTKLNRGMWAAEVAR
jgi:hypothetical protein